METHAHIYAHVFMCIDYEEINYICQITDWPQEIYKSQPLTGSDVSGFIDTPS